MIYESAIYKVNPKKVQEDKRETLYIGAAVLGLILLYIFVIQGFLAFAFLAAVAGGLISVKLQSIKGKGVNRLGSLPIRLILTTEQLTVGDDLFNLSEVTHFEITADDFLGKPYDFIGTSVGVDNYIEFMLNGVDHSYQFQVRRKDDLKILFELEKAIKGTKSSVTGPVPISSNPEGMALL